jgi:hypothetical protein
MGPSPGLFLEGGVLMNRRQNLLADQAIARYDPEQRRQDGLRMRHAGLLDDGEITISMRV